MIQFPAAIRGPIHPDCLSAAAWTAAETGLPVQVVIRRAVGVIAAARSAALDLGVTVTVRVTQQSIYLRFAAEVDIARPSDRPDAALGPDGPQSLQPRV